MHVYSMLRTITILFSALLSGQVLAQSQNTYLRGPILGTEYNTIQSLISVWLSGAAYCDEKQYSTMHLAGPANGFIFGDTLYDSKTDVLGYTGVLPSTKTIYVVFRGSSSLLNWIDDAEVVKTDYTTYPQCNCEVHSGFYKASNGLKAAAIKSVKQLQTLYTDYKQIVVTGHSLGAAVAQLISMELRAAGIQNTIYNYGQPRVGDEKYAVFLDTLFDEPLWRFTHNRDPVVHLPPEAFGYKHSCIEIFENAAGSLRECSKTDCQDKTCSDQFSFSTKNSTDHSYYLEHHLDCGASTV